MTEKPHTPTLAELNHEAVTLSGLCDGAGFILNEISTENTPQANALVALVQQIQRNADDLVQGIQTFEAAQRRAQA